MLENPTKTVNEGFERIKTGFWDFWEGAFSGPKRLWILYYTTMRTPMGSHLGLIFPSLSGLISVSSGSHLGAIFFRSPEDEIRMRGLVPE